MADSLPRSAVSPQNRLPDKAERLAKAPIRKADDADWKVAVGHVVERTRQMSGLSLKEFSAAIHRDERQVARWEDGTDRPQFDAIYAVPRLRAFAVVAFAELANGVGVEVITEIRVRKTA